jgi:hypothetical protein
MSLKKHTKARLSNIIIVMMLLAFSLKAFIPAGFMPGKSAGLTKLVICSGVGQKTIYLPSDKSEDKHESVTEHCAYNVTASFTFLLTPPVFTPPSQSLIQTSPDIDHVALGTKRILALSARGPPRSV